MGDDVLIGGCQCGAVRYRIGGDRPAVLVCHCHECQKQSASAFGMSLAVRSDAFALSGGTATWERGSDAGTRLQCLFCPRCGSRVAHRDPDAPDAVTVKAGSLDDTGWLRPDAHIWTARRQPWVTIEPAVPQHPTQPDDIPAWLAAEQGAAR